MSYHHDVRVVLVACGRSLFCDMTKVRLSLKPTTSCPTFFVILDSFLSAVLDFPNETPPLRD